ncbi:hypothetical protein [Sinorhizobium sp. CCBAU 05631]|uniref:hypothetical protein n=1 Tax=Sinorhizobium sp. CCBAU 05631 TaxID=794846 RepID=UPI00056211D5|nr:hypothetical protein [Sinorhizobium sp. CCBAU 05631]
MPRKRRGTKEPKARRAGNGPSVHAEGSFGAGLDEIGFKPSGKRILVSGTRRNKGPAAEVLKAAADLASPGASQVSKSTLQRMPDDPLGYDPRSPSDILRMVAEAISGENGEAVRREVEAALRRWKLRD